MRRIKASALTKTMRSENKIWPAILLTAIFLITLLGPVSFATLATEAGSSVNRSPSRWASSFASASVERLQSIQTFLRGAEGVQLTQRLPLLGRIGTLQDDSAEALLSAGPLAARLKNVEGPLTAEIVQRAYERARTDVEDSFRTRAYRLSNLVLDERIRREDLSAAHLEMETLARSFDLYGSDIDASIQTVGTLVNRCSDAIRDAHQIAFELQGGATLSTKGANSASLVQIPADSAGPQKKRNSSLKGKIASLLALPKSKGVAANIKTSEVLEGSEWAPSFVPASRATLLSIQKFLSESAGTDLMESLPSLSAMRSFNPESPEPLLAAGPLAARLKSVKGSLTAENITLAYGQARKDVEAQFLAVAMRVAKAIVDKQVTGDDLAEARAEMEASAKSFAFYGGNLDEPLQFVENMALALKDGDPKNAAWHEASEFRMKHSLDDLEDFSID